MLDYGNPLLPVVAAWMERIQAALRFKQKRFGIEAEHGLRFFAGPYDFFFDGLRNNDYFRVPKERLRQGQITVTINKVSEMVQIFGPSLYHANPVRQVTPRDLPAVPPQVFASVMADPNAAALLQQAYMQESQTRVEDEVRALLCGALVNWTPHALNLKTEMRRGIDEALITGLGVLWTETYTPPGSPFKMVGSFHDSYQNLVLDPDATTIDNGSWVARRCVHPVWEVEREYGLPPGYLKPMLESTNQFATVTASEVGPYPRTADCDKKDLVVYWKVYSKMGLGGRMERIAGTDPALRQVLDHFGDHCYLVLCQNVPHPLNLPPWVTEAPDGLVRAQAAAQWPTPYWADGGWPFTPIYFHEVPGDPYPQSHLSPALGELMFLNWAFSKMVSKIKTTSRDLIACLESVEDDLREAIESGEDLEIVKIQAMGSQDLNKLIQFIQHPEWNQDFWTVIQAVMEMFEQRTGLNELLYGQSSRQFRSAEEARVKSEGVNVRPDDMANKVEDAASDMARKEVFASRWHLTPEDVRPILGDVGMLAWAQFVYVSDPRAVIYNLQTRVEAGSARKPNKDKTADDMQQLLPVLFQPLYSYASATGNVTPVNALIEDLCKSLDVKNYQRYMLAAPPPPPEPAGGTTERPTGQAA